MAYEKFKANIVAMKVQEERDRVNVYAQDCNREYEGIVKGLGDTVTIKGAGSVTVRTGNDGKQVKFADPELIEGTSTILTIRQWSDFNFGVPDIDQAMGATGAIDIYTKQAGRKLANEQDRFIANLALDKLALKDKSTAELVTKDTVLGKVDKGLQLLWENGVPQNEQVTIYVSPRFYMLMKQNYTALDTANSELMAKGVIAKYFNINIKLTNTVATGNNGAEDLLMMKTGQAVAFVNPLTKVEPYRPDSFMYDAVKGVDFYDGKILRPKEMVILNCKYA